MIGRVLQIIERRRHSTSDAGRGIRDSQFVCAVFAQNKVRKNKYGECKRDDNCTQSHDRRIGTSRRYISLDFGCPRSAGIRAGQCRTTPLVRSVDSTMWKYVRRSISYCTGLNRSMKARFSSIDDF